MVTLIAVIIFSFPIIAIIGWWWQWRKAKSLKKELKMKESYISNCTLNITTNPVENKKIESTASKIEMSDQQILSIVDKIAKIEAEYDDDFYLTSTLHHYDPLIKDVAIFIIQNNDSSLSSLQNHFFIGYNRASRILHQLEQVGVLGSFNGSKPRDIKEFDKNEINNLINNKIIGSELDPILYDKYKPIIEEKKRYYIQLKEDEKRKEHERSELEEKEKIKKRLLDKKRKRVLEKSAMQELVDEGRLFPEASKRPPIPKEVADTVWNRDGGKCVYCGSTENLHFDHIIPFSKGGATNVENLQLLCQKCNLEKSNKIG